MDTTHGTIRQVSPRDAQRYVVRTTTQVLRDNFGEMPADTVLGLSILTLVPELHRRGVHAEAYGTQGMQFSAFVSVRDLKDYWGYDGSDEDFEEILRETDGTNLITLTIEGQPTRCVEPFVKETIDA